MTAPPPGWYNDPNGQPVERWYDGGKWTEHTRNVPAVTRDQQPERRHSTGRGVTGVIIFIVIIYVLFHAWRYDGCDITPGLLSWPQQCI